LLLAEQAFGLQLRASQVTAARELCYVAAKGQSSVRQMIMGSGAYIVAMSCVHSPFRVLKLVAMFIVFTSLA